MNSKVKELLYFVSGALIGSGVTYYFVKKAFEMKADEEIMCVKKAYEDRLRNIEDNKSSINGDLKGPKEIDTKEKVKQLNNKPDLLDYTKYFKPSSEGLSTGSELLRDAKKDAIENGLSEEELAEMEGPQDDEPYSDEEDRDQTLEYEDYQLNGAHKRALEKGKPPFEIAPEDYALTCDNYEKMSLLYYVPDEILANEAEEIVDEALFVGTLISDSGFDYNNQDVMYVRNDRLMCDFEITKLYEQFDRKE